MQPQIDHVGLEVLSEEECWRLLDEQRVGRLGVAIKNAPEIYPVNYVVHDRTIVFLTAEGTKFAAAVLGSAVAFEVDQSDQDLRTGWSVMVRGTAHEIERMDDLIEAEELPLTTWTSGRKTRYVRIQPLAVSGRRIIPTE